MLVSAHVTISPVELCSAYNPEQAGVAALDAAEDPDEDTVLDGTFAVWLGLAVVRVNKASLRTHSASVQEANGARNSIWCVSCGAPVITEAGTTGCFLEYRSS